MTTKKRLTELRSAWHGCDRCALSELREGPRIVFGDGDPEAEILFVTEAATRDDMLAGAPLSGDLGEIFAEVVSAAGINPVHTFIAPLVSCRPFVVIPATETSDETEQDSSPSKEHIAACLPRLHEIIYTIDPRLIIALGDSPFKALVASKDRGKDNNTIAKAHGKLFNARLQGRIRQLTYPLLALLAPQQLVANPSSAEHAPIATTSRALHRAGRFISWIKRNEARE